MGLFGRIIGHGEGGVGGKRRAPGAGVGAQPRDEDLLRIVPLLQRPAHVPVPFGLVVEPEVAGVVEDGGLDGLVEGEGNVLHAMVGCLADVALQIVAEDLLAQRRALHADVGEEQSRIALVIQAGDDACVVEVSSVIVCLV